MTRWSSCGLLLAFALVTARPAAAQEATGPRTYDLTLERALELARTGAPSTRVARARIGEARGQLVDAEVLLRANPTFDIGGGPHIGPAGVGPDVEVGVGQVFELGGPRRARIDAARAGLERAEATAEDEVRRTLREVTEAASAAAVRTAYETYQRLLAAVEHFEEDGLPLIERSDAFARRSYEEGATPLVDLLAVRRELVDARVTYVDLLLSAALAGGGLEAEAGGLR